MARPGPNRLVSFYGQQQHQRPRDYCAGDVRYSSIFMSNHEGLFGYGPSLTDFRSGEILVAHVLLGFDAFSETVSRHTLEPFATAATTPPAYVGGRGAPRSRLRCGTARPGPLLLLLLASTACCVGVGVECGVWVVGVG